MRGVNNKTGFGASFRDETGNQYGRLKVVKLHGRKDGQVIWDCICDCGRTVFVPTHSLRAGNTSSCGCLKLELIRARSTKHGGSAIPEYRVFHVMLDRCYRKTCKNFKEYGARGITVCERWRTSFPNFISDMGRRPTPLHTIERINNDGNYEPGNCRWATRLEQGGNRRNTIVLTAFGKTKTIPQWCKDTGLNYSTLIKRHRQGWTAERALTP